MLRFVIPAACAQAMTAFVLADVGASRDGAWTLMDAAPIELQVGEPWIRPPVAKFATLAIAPIEALLARAPMEFTPAAANPLRIELPMPDGTFVRFDVVESPVMHPDLGAKFPEIRTYAGQGVDDPHASLRFDLTPQGFHAQVLSSNGDAYIDPYTRDNAALYSVYYKRDYPRKSDGWKCHTQDMPALAGLAGRVNVLGGPDTGETLRTYRLANAATGEYTVFHGGTVPLGQAAIVTAVNRVTGVYQVDFSIRMQLIANNSSVVYTNGATDPYTNNNGGAMLAQNQTTLDTVIGTANYDMGHVFSTGGGGIAGLSVICRAGLKAQGVTGLPQPIGDPFYIDYVAHEMGHQFGGNHSFNSAVCAGARVASAAYEVGSGSTIMSYAGICGADNIQNNSNAYFVFHNFTEIRNYASLGLGNPCAQQTATGNNDPIVNAGIDRTIPRGTAFQLTALGSDPNSDPITYCWEQRNLGPAQGAAGGQFADNGSSPIFRSFSPVTSPTRVFPRLSNILTNTTVIGETYPQTNRTLIFRCTVRDNRVTGGGVGFDDVNVVVTTAAGPFQVTAPNTNVSWSGAQTVTWSVASTNLAPVNCANVNILLSTDGGQTYPTTLKANTPNDGSESVTLPATPTTQARIRVEAADNIFFDLSNTNFSITVPPCYPDCNNDGQLSVIDFGCFQSFYVLQTPYGDCNLDGQWSVSDFGCFQGKYVIGCP
ncbi:MAG: reprolysin-like metallopeptidase [Phycisphaerales bacterium]